MRVWEDRELAKAVSSSLAPLLGRSLHGDLRLQSSLGPMIASPLSAIALFGVSRLDLLN